MDRRRLNEPGDFPRVSPPSSSCPIPGGNMSTRLLAIRHERKNLRSKSKSKMKKRKQSCLTGLLGENPPPTWQMNCAQAELKLPVSKEVGRAQFEGSWHPGAEHCSATNAAKIAGIAIGLLQSPLPKRTARWFSQDRTGLLLMPWLEGLRRLRAPSKGAPLPREVMAHGQNMM